MNTKTTHRWGVVGAALPVVLVAIVALYAPFSGNPAVFDDHNVITNLAAYDYAQEIFSRYTRSFPYFSIGFVHLLSGGDLAWNRFLGIALHGLVVVALYFFLSRAIARIVGVDDDRRRWVVALACLWVALNPVAVYASGYLIQRTIVLATLFAILSANLYLRAQQRERNVDLLSAALLAGLSIMSKEHAVLLPCAVVVLTPFVCDWSRAAVGRALAYLSLSLPCSVWALLNRGRDIVGTNYEIYASDVLSQFASLGVFDFPGGIWGMSVSTQLLLFWKYMFLWLVPNPLWMSADLRIDFPALWSGWEALAGIAGALATLAVFVGAVFYWLRSGARGRAGQLSAALLFAAIPFLVELSVVRVQEPFVLYRSFLWMPAYALLLCLALSWSSAWVKGRSVFARRIYWGSMLLACLSLFPMAQNRLQSFSSEEALWQDALRKLPSPDVAGADRIYYNLAGEAYKAKRYSEALEFSERVIVQNPRAFQGYLAKGTSLLALADIDGASRAFDEASAHQPPAAFRGYIEFKRCLVLEAQGNTEAIPACLRRSAEMGYGGAEFRLKMMGLSTTE